MTSVFISHSPHDEDVHDDLTDALDLDGFTVVSEEESSDSNWTSTIVSDIRRADIVVAYLGGSEVASNVLIEIGYALGAGKAVLVVREGYLPRLPVELAALPVIVVSGLSAQALESIADHIRRLVPAKVPLRPQFNSAREELSTVVQDAAYFEQLPPQRFEQLIAGFFNEIGINARLSDHRQAGFDIVLEGVRPGERVVVEVRKQAPQTRLGISAIQRLVGASVVEEVSCALVISSAEFTRSAIEFAAQAPITVRLITIKELLSLTKESILELSNRKVRSGS